MTLINSHAIQLQSSALGGLTTTVLSGGDLHSLFLGILVAVGSYAIINSGKPFTSWWSVAKKHGSWLLQQAIDIVLPLSPPTKKKSKKRRK